MSKTIKYLKENNLFLKNSVSIINITAVKTAGIFENTEIIPKIYKQENIIILACFIYQKVI